MENPFDADIHAQLKGERMDRKGKIGRKKIAGKYLKGQDN